MDIHNEQDSPTPIKLNITPLSRVDPQMKVSKEQWEVIKALYCAGEKATVIAPKYGIKPETINKKAYKDKWPTPGRIKLAQANPMVETNDPAQALAALWTERGEQSRESVYQGAKKALDRFFAMSPIPQTFQEAAVAHKMLKEAVDPTGSNEGQRTNVNIAVLTNKGFAPIPSNGSEPIDV
jgi:hypothetical protein